MKRRHFLGAASAAAGAAVWPRFLREAFGDEGACDTSALTRLAAIAASFRAAREAQKALLCLVIPEDNMQKWERGELWGAFLNHASDRQIAPLAQVEVCAATMADLRRLVPAAGAGEPLMVLVRTDRAPASARQIDGELPTLTGDRGDGEERASWEEMRRREDALTDKRIEAVAALVRAALGADDPRAGTMAAEARAAVTSKPPRGARWAHSSGCGVSIEGPPTDRMLSVSCGMGHVPEKSQRFLYFFTKGPYE